MWLSNPRFNDDPVPISPICYPWHAMTAVLCTHRLMLTLRWLLTTLALHTFLQLKDISLSVFDSDKLVCVDIDFNVSKLL